MVGGFLGAGKTTTIARLAKHFMSEGKRVGIVTNDQTTDLVDTNLLRAQGFDVGEVAGSCFCCNFNGLTETVEKFGSSELPDIIIAEPVGSCTDLVATVLRPLQQIYQRPFDIAPYGVIVKPSHGLKILKRIQKGGFSPQAEYIFRKQIEEADFVILNRIDELSPEQVDELGALIETDFPDRTCIRVSAKSGEGFDQFLEYLDRRGEAGKQIIDVDYDVYAEGEAELGWLNAQFVIEGTEPFEIDSFLVALATRIQSSLEGDANEIAHLKVIANCDGLFGVVNVISSDTPPVLSVPAKGTGNRVELTINARVAMDPDGLASVVEGSLHSLGEERSLAVILRTLQCFRPGRPVPTHRI